MIRRLKIFSKLFRAMQLLTVFSVMLSLSGFTQTAKEKEKLQQSKQKIEEEIRYTNGLLEQTRKNKKTSLNRLKILTKQIKSREALLRTINRELNEVNVTMAADSIRIARLSKELQELKSEYARMIRYAHRTMNGNNKLMFIFSARDFNQAYLRLKYYQQYAAYRRQQAARIEATQKAIHAHRAELEETRNLKLNLMVNKQSEKQKLDQEKTEKASAVKELTATEKQLLATIRAKQQAAVRLEKAIEKLIADEIRASEKRMRKKEDKSSKPSVMDFTPKEKELSSSFSMNRGRLPWPCDRGFISGNFGEHAHPVLQHVKVKNNGIDIMTGQGAAVKSVFGGKVSKVMAFPGYNNVVIIRHGEFLTVYSNLGEVNVAEGQEVAVKQVIGKVYTGPGDQKTELHFELWHGKVIQNPENWLAGR